MANFLGAPKSQFFKTGKSVPLAYGKVYVYESGTYIPTNSYSSSADAISGENPNSNPIILDERGEALIVLANTARIAVHDAEDCLVWSEDGVRARGDSGGSIQYAFSVNGVNYVTMSNAIALESPSVYSSGPTSNVGMIIKAKGAGNLEFGSPVTINKTSSGTVRFQNNSIVEGSTQANGNITVGSGVTAESLEIGGEFSADSLITASIDVSGDVSFFPAGMMSYIGNTTVPSGWLECDGSAISRTTYSTLFAAISTTFGSGDGSTTFNLPTSARITIVGSGGTGTVTLGSTLGSTGGSETHTLTIPEMPAHTHTVEDNTGGSVDANWPEQYVMQSKTATTTGSTGGGDPHNNIQPSVVMMCIIKT